MGQTIVKDKLRKENALPRKGGKKKGFLQFEEHHSRILECVTSTPKTTQTIFKELQDKCEKADIPQIRAWHTVKKYLDRLAGMSYIRSTQGNGERPMTFYFR